MDLRGRPILLNIILIAASTTVIHEAIIKEQPTIIYTIKHAENVEQYILSLTSEEVCSVMMLLSEKTF